MSADLYKLCPCGSGKKIKFCCRDIISDLERIRRMIDGEQRLAALEKIDKLLEKHPRRPALLCERARVQMQLKQWDEARKSVETLLEEDEASMTGLALRSMMRVQDGNLSDAVLDVHRALEVGERVVTQPIYEAIYSLCVGFLVSGNVLAARAYLLLLVTLSRGEDRRSLSMLMDLEAEPRISILLKDDFPMSPCPQKVTWRREFEVAMEAEKSGDWLTAAQQLQSMSERILDEPAIIRNLAILKGRIGDWRAAARAWREYSKLADQPLDDLVEAEARAQLLEDTPDRDQYDLVTVTQEIDDADRVMERLLSDPRAVNSPPQEEPQEGPPPKAGFTILDRPVPGAEGLTLEQIPLHVASLLLYGRETDRSPRLVILITRDEAFDDAMRLISDMTGHEVSGGQDVEVRSRIHKIGAMMTPRLAFPAELSPAQRQPLVTEWMRDVLLNKWPETKLAVFGDHSASEAADDPSLRVRVLAAILNLELEIESADIDIDLNELRRRLHLPTREMIDPGQVDLDMLPFVRFGRLEVSRLSDDDLVRLYKLTVGRGSNRGFRRLAEEVLRRPQLDQVVNKIEVHEYLADAFNDLEKTLEHLAAARQMGVAQGESPARWLISELEVHLTRADIAQAQRLISEIQARYINEPGVGQSLMEVLTQFGLIRPTGGAVDPTRQPAQETAQQPVAAGAEPASAGIWTPGNEGSSAPADGGKESKLWMPGME